MYKSKLLLMFFFLLVISFGKQLIAQETEDLMEMSLEDLLNMDVTTASKSAEKLSDAPGIISVVTNDELQRFGGTTLRDVLERVPSLIASGANYTNRTTIAPRGDQIKQNSSHVLILVNGRPIREIQEGGVSSDVWETFPVNIIDRIEVIKGPGSVLYGSDAFSGVINVITKQATKTSVAAMGQGGPGGAYIASVNGTTKLGDLQIVAAARIYEKEKWEPDFKTTNTVYVSIDSVTVVPVTTDTTVNLNIPNKGTGAYLGLNYKGITLTSSYHDWTTSYIQGMTLGETQLKKSFNNLGYSLNISENWIVDFNLTYVASKLFGPVVSKRSCYNMVAEVTNSINLNDKSKLVVGGLFNKNNGKERSYPTAASAFGPATPSQVISDGDISSYAFYAQIDYRLLEMLKLIGGMQANKVENIDLNVLPRLGIIYNPLPRITVKALYSTAFRAPSINETSIDYLGFFLGDPKLKPEKVATIDLSLGYQGESMQAGVTFFHSKMTDNIQTIPFVIPNSPFPGSIYSNVGKVTFNGIEVEGKYYVTRSLFAYGSLLYQANKDQNDVKEVTPISTTGAKAGVSYNWDKGILVSLSGLYQGDLNKRFTKEKNPNQGAYTLVFLHSNINFNKLLNMTMKPNVSLVIDVDNVLDKPHFGYDLGGGTGDGIPSIPGRAIYAGLEVSLD
jgi:outer membrane receptor for ferrienterochelin and colicins